MEIFRATQSTVLQENLVLFERDEISYEVLTTQDVNDAIQCLMTTFLTKEPMTQALHISTETFGYFTELFCTKAASDGVSVVAKDVQNGVLVGCLISEDFEGEPPEGLESLHSEFDPILALLDTLDRTYRESHPCKMNEWLHEFMMGVYEEYRGRSIGYHLIEASHVLGRTKGFKGALAEVTGPISQRIFIDKHHYHILDSIKYNEFKYLEKISFEGVSNCDSCQLVQKDFHSENEQIQITQLED